MIRLGVIGLGSIFTTQLQALRTLSETFRIAAVCDADAQKRTLFCEKFSAEEFDVSPRIYETADELFDDAQIDAVLISTPPATHFSLARSGLNKGKAVLLEKPAVLNTDELTRLYALADSNNAFLHIAFHAAFAQELEWFLARADEIIPSPVSEIECRFYDPYMQGNSVFPERRALGGCYIDSGVNALSVCARLADLKKFRLQQKHELSENIPDGVVYEACHTFASAEQKIVIKTGWNLGINHKSTLLRFSHSDTEILLDHSQQQVVCLRGDSQRVLFRYTENERLPAQYCGVFREFAQAYYSGKDNRETAKLVHELLLLGQTCANT
ncbi:MAG: Gfo/Idh/MocA family protein [Oscillospiraceae bacterium]